MSYKNILKISTLSYKKLEMELFQMCIKYIRLVIEKKVLRRSMLLNKFQNFKKVTQELIA